MAFDRRDFLRGSAGAAGAALSSRSLAEGVQPAGDARWIWYPGQLAAFRHQRRMRLAMERCTHVGYPGNFRQPLAHAWFRRLGSADRDVPLRWIGPVGRIRLSAGGEGGEITERRRLFRRGTSDIIVQIDLADTMPCLFLEGGSFSTGEQWEVSLDGETWRLAETSDFNDPNRLPDAERERTVVLPVVRTLPAMPPFTRLAVAPGRDVILDFQETELGHLAFTAIGGGALTVQVGESVAEVRDPDSRRFEQYPLPEIRLTGNRQALSLPERALRFARVSSTAPAELTDVHFKAKLWPAREQGSFECSDPELNAIWRVGVATLRSNMHDFYLDGIRRDGLVWHDGPLCLEAYERVFFDADLSRQTLLSQTLPENPGVRDVGIIDSQMYTLIAFEIEHRMRGDARFPRMFRDRIEAMLKFYTDLQDDHGFVSGHWAQPYGFFPDWTANAATGPDPAGVPSYGQMLLAGAFAAGARLAATWGDQEAAAAHAENATTIRANIRARFRDPKTGLYFNGLTRTGAMDSRFTTFAQAFAVAYDVARPLEVQALFDFLEDRRRRPSRISLSQVVELSAYARAGRTKQGRRRLKESWLPMVKAGYRRFFEDFDPARDDQTQLAMYDRKFANSLCHAWAGAAPIMLLSRGILGVEPTAAGFQHCRIEPQTAGLRSGTGTVPTPSGPILLEWSGRRGSLVLPRGITAQLSDGREVTGGTHGLELG